MITSSVERPLAPNPPPTSGAITRTCSGSTPSSVPSTILSWCGVWVETQISRRPFSSQLAAVARGSIGQAAIRWLM